MSLANITYLVLVVAAFAAFIGVLGATTLYVRFDKHPTKSGGREPQ